MNVYSTTLEMSNKRRAAFAEAAVREAFRGRELSLAREPDFVDLTPREVASLNRGVPQHA